MAFNDIYKLIIHQRMHGQEVINKLHFVQEALNPGNCAQLLVDDFRANLDTTMRARATNELVFEFIEAQRIVPFGDGPSISTYPASTVGQAPTGSAFTGMICEVVTVYTAGAGRRKRGRMYLSGLGSSAMANGVVVSTQTTRTVAFATALATRYINAPLPGGFALGVWSRVNAGPTPPWPTDAFTRATGLTVRTILRTQRRRQIGVGR